MPHTCNFYCDQRVHAISVLTSEGATEDMLRECYTHAGYVVHHVRRVLEGERSQFLALGLTGWSRDGSIMPSQVPENYTAMWTVFLERAGDVDSEWP